MYIFSPSYEQLVIYFLVSTALSLLVFFLPYILAPKVFWAEKLSAYECGFEPFVAPREVFESHFIVVGILFIIFDLELIFLLPWAATAGVAGYTGVLNLIVYLVLLGVALLHEWRRGALLWPIFFIFKKKDFFK